MLIGVLAATLGALGYGVASVLQSHAAASANGLAVVRRPAYLIGLSLDGLAWLASLVALGSLPLFVAQSLLASSVAVTVIVAHLVSRTRARPADVMASGAFVLAVGLLAWSAGPLSVDAGPPRLPLALLAGSVAVAVLTLVKQETWSPRRLAVLSGVAFAGMALSARSVTFGGVASFLIDPAVWAVVTYSMVGMWNYTRSLEKGNVGSVTAVLWITEIAVSSIAGLLLLGDTIRPGFISVAVLGLAGAVAACHVLASSPDLPRDRDRADESEVVGTLRLGDL